MSSGEMQAKIRTMAYSRGNAMSWIHLILTEESARQAADVARRTLAARGVPNPDGLVTHGPSTIYADTWMITINYPGVTFVGLKPGRGASQQWKADAAQAALDAAFSVVQLVKTYRHKLT